MPKNLCISCNAPIDKGTVFCPFCGTEQPPEISGNKKKTRGQHNIPVVKPGIDTTVPVKVKPEDKIISKPKEEIKSKDTLGKEVKEAKVSSEDKDLEYLAFHDELTGLKNRNAFENEIEEFDTKTLCVLSVDANNLKKTNDTYGHKYGDILISSIADALKDTFGKEHSYRTGGDEFTVAVVGERKGSITSKIEHFRELLKEKEEDLQESDNIQSILITAAIGYAFGDGRKKLQDILDEADEAMYEDKRSYSKDETGAWNKKAYEDALDKTYSNFVSVVSVDAIDLKTTNSSLGMEYGDIQIKSVADALIEAFGDNVYHVFGGRFFVILEGIKADTITKKIDVYRRALKNIQNDQEVHINMLTADGFVVGEATDTARDLVKAAENKMLEHKSKLTSIYNPNYDGFYDDVKAEYEELKEKYTSETIKNVGKIIVIAIILFAFVYFFV